MKDIDTSFDYDLNDLNRADWIERVESISEDHGYAEPVGPSHTAYLIDAGRTLLVTFETVASVRMNNDDKTPLGWPFVQSHGWSSLTLMANAEPDWFRHPAMYGYFDRLIDDGFFDDFDQVLFYGAGAAGYAAAAYSIAAPDAQVLLIQPQATLDTRIAGWDKRFPEARRTDFTSRFAYAPEMLETADTVTVIHDPSVIEDTMHASLFNGDNTTHFTCPYIGPEADRAFITMDVLPDLIEQAMDATLTQHNFAALWRARQTFMPYLRTLLLRLEIEDRHERLMARLCRKVGADGRRPMFSQKYDELKAKGINL
ncbi:MAG: hypothetical protein ACSHW1_20340 [Yoonia sp.]|uniref:hypothetical protein n=1 Tax=Yoonia sp. TaxID=2212373 RepID=UPI003EF97DCC